MRMMKTSAALIGYGYWGTKVASVLENYFQQIYIVDQEKKPIKKPYLSRELAEILSDQKIKYCFIVTPEDTHFEIARLCLKYGKHIFIEKPLVLSTLEAKQLIKLSLQKKVCLYVDYIFLHDPGYHQIKKIVTEKLGPIKEVISTRWTKRKVVPNISVLDDLLIHDLYLARDLLGIQPKLDKQSLMNNTTNLLDSSVTLLLNRKRYRTHLSWIRSSVVRSLLVVGQHGCVIWEKNNPHDTIRTYLISSQDEVLVSQKEIKHTLSPLQKSVLSFLRLTESEGKELRWKRLKKYIADVSIIDAIRTEK